mgnify:CR=1 FL=1
MSCINHENYNCRYDDSSSRVKAAVEGIREMLSPDRLKELDSLLSVLSVEEVEFNMELKAYRLSPVYRYRATFYFCCGGIKGSFEMKW